MSAASPPVISDQVERKARSLRLSGHPEARLRRACAAVAAQSLPLRDAIVLREAQRLADAETPQARTAWAAAIDRLRDQVPESTFRLWLEPLVLVGEEGTALVIDGPEGIRAWAERRYSALIAKALAGVSDFTAVRFVPTGESA